MSNLTRTPPSTLAPARTRREVVRNCDPEEPLQSDDDRSQDARRVDLDVILPDKAARDRLIGASGGAMRELLDLVFQSALLARGEAITEADVERAVGRRKQRLRDLINANGWIETLVRIANEKQIHPDPRTEPRS